MMWLHRSEHRNRRPSLLAFALVVLPLIGWLAPPVSGQERARIPTDPADPLLNQGPKAEAVGAHGMVSTQLASSTIAALEVLKAGGNAVDAALTALFLQQVHDYHMVFLFGSMSALYYDAAKDKVYAINANAGWPRPDRGESGDPSIVTIGGTVKGAAALAERFGSWRWGHIIQPAVEAAEEGAIVTSFMYGLNFGMWEQGYLSDLRKHKEAREFYMPDGHLVGVGQRWKMPALAETLRQIAADPDYMYTGAWGEKFVEAATNAGGRITMEDMAEYDVQWSDPVRFSYRGHEILGSPPPDDGGQSRLVFTYLRADERGKPSLGKLGFIKVSLKLVGEPLHWAVGKEGLEPFLERAGCQLLGSPERFDLHRRYLEPAGLGDQPVGKIEQVAVAAI